MAQHPSPLAIVTGGASGLGHAIVQQLIERQYTVCNIDFDAAKMAALQTTMGPRYYGYVGDASDEAFIASCIGEISQLGHISLLVNNAGQPSFKAPTAYTSADVERCLTGLRAMIAWSTAVLKASGERESKIINVMSSAALRGNPHESVYCAAKWGERGYTESLKAAYKGSSVKIVGFYPGGIDTDFYTESRDYVDETKQHGFMKPQELAQVLLDSTLSKANLTVADLVVERNPQ